MKQNVPLATSESKLALGSSSNSRPANKRVKAQFQQPHRAKLTIAQHFHRNANVAYGGSSRRSPAHTNADTGHNSTSGKCKRTSATVAGCKQIAARTRRLRNFDPGPTANANAGVDCRLRDTRPGATVCPREDKLVTPWPWPWTNEFVVSQVTREDGREQDTICTVDRCTRISVVNILYM